MFHANVASRLAGRLVSVPWIVGGLRVAERQKRWHLLLDRLTARLGTGSVCVSEGVFRFSCAVGGLKADRLVVIPNGIEPAPYDTAEPLARQLLAIPEGAPLALFVGRFDEQKGLPFLLDAAEHVIGSRPDWRLLLVGDGPERDQILRRIAESPRLADRVRWLGRRDDIASLLKSADLLVLPSLWEGMPNVVLEAMAARRPVVATAIEGTEDLVIEGQTGWLVPPSDAPALARALLDAAIDPERSRRAGEAGRVRVESHFTLPRLVASYESLWARLLGFEEVAGAVPLAWNSVPASSFVPPPLAPRGR
jgi:starch synthase (maltosyl-transferring)